MSSPLKIQAEEIEVGKAITTPIFDEKGRLLLRKGFIVQTQKQLDGLILRGLYRQSDSSNVTESKTSKPKAVLINPFQTLEFLTKRLKEIFSGLIDQNAEMPTRIRHLAQDLLVMCKQDIDTSLAAVQMNHELDYVLAHPLHVAILCDLVADFLKYDEERRERLIVAALTANLGMLSLQALLHRQQGPLSTEQQRTIQAHPQKSVDILRSAGVDDELWLSIVLQHHERDDGSGYHGLKADEITEEAKIIALADRYSAMVSPRVHRSALSANDSLKSLFLNKGKDHDETLSLVFIKLLGIFPPGSFVLLENGEIAIVTKRPTTGMWPTVKSILSPRGGAFGEPLTRDCNDAAHKIKEICMPENLPPLNHTKLWGYTNQ